MFTLKLMARKIKGIVRAADLEVTDKANRTQEKAIHLRLLCPCKKARRLANPKKKQSRVLI